MQRRLFTAPYFFAAILVSFVLRGRASGFIAVGRGNPFPTPEKDLTLIQDGRR